MRAARPPASCRGGLQGRDQHPAPCLPARRLPAYETIATVTTVYDSISLPAPSLPATTPAISCSRTPARCRDMLPASLPTLTRPWINPRQILALWGLESQVNTPSINRLAATGPAAARRAARLPTHYTQPTEPAQPNKPNKPSQPASAAREATAGRGTGSETPARAAIGRGLLFAAGTAAVYAAMHRRCAGTRTATAPRTPTPPQHTPTPRRSRRRYGRWGHPAAGRGAACGRMAAPPADISIASRINLFARRRRAPPCVLTVRGRRCARTQNGALAVGRRRSVPQRWSRKQRRRKWWVELEGQQHGLLLVFVFIACVEKLESRMLVS